MKTSITRALALLCLISVAVEAKPKAPAKSKAPAAAAKPAKTAQPPEDDARCPQITRDGFPAIPPTGPANRLAVVRAAMNEVGKTSSDPKRGARFPGRVGADRLQLYIMT